MQRLLKHFIIVLCLSVLILANAGQDAEMLDETPVATTFKSDSQDKTSTSSSTSSDNNEETSFKIIAPTEEQEKIDKPAETPGEVKKDSKD